MPVKEQLNEMLAAVRSDCYQKYLLFAGHDGFQEDQFVQHTLRLFGTLNDFRKRFLILNNIPIGESLVEKCKEKIQELETEELADYFEKLNRLAQFLDNFLIRRPDLERLNEANPEPTPINRRIIDEGLQPQAGIIDAKKMEIVNSGEPFDEEAFQKSNGLLIFSRNLYWRQLLKNIVEGTLDDLFDIRDSNDDIRNAQADNFIIRIDAARLLIDSKIKPVFT